MDQYAEQERKRAMLSAFKQSLAGQIDKGKPKGEGRNIFELRKKEEEERFPILQPQRKRKNTGQSQLGNQVELMIDNTALLIDNMARLVALRLQESEPN